MSYKFILSRIPRTVSVMDLRDDLETRKARCDKFALKNRTCGKVASFWMAGGAK